RVDLPAPLRPTRQIRSPSPTAAVSPSNSGTEPSRTEASRKARRGGGMNSGDQWSWGADRVRARPCISPRRSWKRCLPRRGGPQRIRWSPPSRRALHQDLDPAIELPARLGAVVRAGLELAATDGAHAVG